MTGFNENFVGAAVVSGDCDGLVEETVESLDTDSFVIAFGSGVKGESQ
jgi:hypothetical protein